MSATETEQGQQVESRSSVSISMDLKGLAKVSVKVYVSDEHETLELARLAAISAFNATKNSVA